MSDPALITRHLNHLQCIVKAYQANWTSPHSGSVSCCRWWTASLFPRHTISKTTRSCIGSKTSANDTIFAKNVRNSASIVFGIEPFALTVALEKLAGKLRVVGILTNQCQILMVRFIKPCGHLLISVVVANTWQVPFNRKTECITKALTN